jgi:hypothetical protein
MNTHNVNVKTAAPESSERWEKTTYLRTDGFVRNIHSSNPFDVVRADVVLLRMEKHAHRGCGLHYEIYNARALAGVCAGLSGAVTPERPSCIHGGGGKARVHAHLYRRTTRAGRLRQFNERNCAIRLLTRTAADDAALTQRRR